jgi:hypothetical protein
VKLRRQSDKVFEYIVRDPIQVRHPLALQFLWTHIPYSVWRHYDARVFVDGEGEGLNGT